MLTFTAGLVLVGALVFYVFESRNDEMLRNAPLLDRVATSTFQSINRTSGFSTVDFGKATDETTAFYNGADVHREGLPRPLPGGSRSTHSR